MLFQLFHEFRALRPNNEKQQVALNFEERLFPSAASSCLCDAQLFHTTQLISVVLNLTHGSHTTQF